MSSSNFQAHPAVILLAGLPGSGKTTFAHALLSEITAVHVESDAIRRELTPVPQYTPPEHARVFRIAEDRACKALESGSHVIVDATNLLAKDRRRFVRLAARRNARIIAVHVTAPAAVVRERLSHPRTGFSQANVEVFDAMRGDFQRFSEPSITVDTRFNLAPSVAAVGALVAGPGPAPEAGSPP